MADVLQTSLSALLTSQRALATTGHNIANVNTPGYSRQRVELGTRIADITGSGAIGNGVNLMNITRSYDAYLGSSLRDTQSSFSRLDTFLSYTNSVDQLLSDENAGVAPSLQAFFSAAQDVANDPSSLPSRQVFVSEAEGIADRFQSLAGRFNDIESQLSAQLQQEVDDIQNLAQSIADLNEEIVAASSVSIGLPNDLLDQRDHLINQLSAKIDVRTTTQDDGSINVQIGTGQTLVTGQEVSELSVGADPSNPTRLNVFVDNGVGRANISSGLSGGTLGGIMDFRREVLDTARSDIGRIAVAFVTSVNAQQASGMDLDGNLGSPLFSVAPPGVVPSLDNTGGASVSSQIEDVGALTGTDYTLSFDAGAYTLNRVDTGEPVALSGSGTDADPFVADGLSFTVSGAPANGDAYLIQPTINAASSVQAEISSPRGIAAASPLRTVTDSQNTGSGAISLQGVQDTGNPALLSTSVIEFTSATTYQINGAGSFTFNADQPINLNGATVQISGTPAAGDTFTVEPNTGGVGDNTNILALANLQSVGVLDGGTSSLTSSVGQLVAEVGSTARQANNNLTAQGVLLNQSINQRDAISGVNLDEEAANMLRYQQAYEAAARMITVADQMFGTLLNAIGR